ncbi:MAG: hypothetical protein GY710_04165 [Desulfobacteraceae bacterium]|nr:hypothetical protein [Desulfobacteraceae bacterium]
MPKYYDNVINLIQHDVRFQTKFHMGYNEGHPAASIIVYARWLGTKKKSIQEAHESKEREISLITEWVLLNYIYDDKLFQEDLQKDDPGFYREVNPYLTAGNPRLSDMGEGLKKPLIYEHYRFYLDHLIQMLEIAVKEDNIIKSTFRCDERVTLMVELGDAKRSIKQAKEKRLSYRRASSDKSKLKRQVLEFLGWNRTMGLTNLKTEDLIIRLNNKVWEYQGVLDEVKSEFGKTFKSHRPNDRIRRKKLYEKLFEYRELNRTAKKYITDLRNAQQAKLTAKNTDLMSSVGVKRKFNITNTKVTGLDTIVQNNLLTKDHGAGSELHMEKLQNELDDLVMVQSPKLALAIHNTQDALATYKGLSHVSDDLKPVIGRSCEAELRFLYRKKQRLLRRQQDLMENLALAGETYGGVMETISHEIDAHKVMLAKRDWVKREYRNLEKLKKVATALNVYCSLYDFSFGLMLSLGNMVGADATESVNKNLLGKGMEHLCKALVVGGVSPFTKAYDTGSFDLSLKLGLSFGPDLSGQVSSTMGLVLVYGAGISVEDDRRFRAESTWTVKATGEAKISELFKAALELELYENKTLFVFQDQYHWAAWFCQKFARLVAMVRACDQACMEQRMDQFSQPTPSEMRQLQEVADITMQTEPRLRNILDEIAVYTNYRVVKLEDTSKMGGIDSSVSFAGDFLGGGITVQKPKHAHYSRLKFDPDDNVIMDSNGYEVVEKRHSKGWSVKGSLTLPGVTATISFIHLEDLPYPDDNGNCLFIQLKFLGLSGVKIGNKEALESSSESEESFDGAFSKWIEKNLLPAAKKVDTAIPGWMSGFQGVLKNKKITELAREYNLAVMEFNLFQPEIRSEKQWILQYWWANGGVGNSFEFTVPTGHGLNIVTGAEFSLNRSFWEHVGTNSVTYLLKVYNGFRDIPEQQVPQVLNGRSPKTLRPNRAAGKALWKDFKEAHKNNFWKIGQNIGIRGSWVRKEVEYSGVPHNSLIEFCTGNLQGSFNQTLFNRLMVKMDNFLEYMAQKIDGEENPKWHAVHHMSESEKKFNQVSKGFVKQRAPLKFLNQAKALEMRMQPFKRQGYFSKDTPFTLEDCKQALNDGGYDMEQTFETLKSQAVVPFDGQFQMLHSRQLLGRALEACKHYINDLSKASDWNFFQVRHRHGSGGVARATCLRNCLTIIQGVGDSQKRLNLAGEFIQKYINATLEINDVNEVMKFDNCVLGDKNTYFDTVTAHTKLLNGGGKSQNSLRMIITKQCITHV